MLDKRKKDIFPINCTLYQLLALTGVIACIYFIFSIFSEGFYQQDEAAHYLNMRRFWYDPNIILGNWAKPGYKLITAPVALLGRDALIIFNSLISAFCCYVAYRLSEEVGAKAPVLAVLLLFLQPFWLQLSFRNYSELLSALILAIAILYQYRNKYWIAALCLSYLVLIRQEAYLLFIFYGFYLLINRKYKPLLLLFIFPLFHNFWGMYVTGDPLYLINSVLGFSSTAQDAYPRQGFIHYFKMSLTIFGGPSLTFFLVYLVTNFLNKQKKWHWFILGPLLIYFLAHVLFSIQYFKIGPSTGGNLRYLIVISPLVAVLGGLALERLQQFKTLSSKKGVLLTVLIFSFLVAVSLSYKHNNIMLTNERDFLPLITVILSTLLIIIPLSLRKKIYVTLVIAVISGYLVVEPFPRSYEDQLVAKYVETAKERNLDRFPILANHTMFYYFWGKTQEEFENGAERISKKTIENSLPGTIIIWDSHYSYRPKLRDNQVPHTFFLDRPQKFPQYYNPVSTPDRRFAIFTFQKANL